MVKIFDKVPSHGATQSEGKHLDRHERGDEALNLRDNRLPGRRTREPRVFGVDELDKEWKESARKCLNEYRPTLEEAAKEIARRQRTGHHLTKEEKAHIVCELADTQDLAQKGSSMKRTPMKDGMLVDAKVLLDALKLYEAEMRKKK